MRRFWTGGIGTGKSTRLREWLAARGGAARGWRTGFGDGRRGGETIVLESWNGAVRGVVARRRADAAGRRGVEAYELDAASFRGLAERCAAGEGLLAIDELGVLELRDEALARRLAEIAGGAEECVVVIQARAWEAWKGRLGIRAAETEGTGGTTGTDGTGGGAT